jgi:hypothetical protein
MKPGIDNTIKTKYFSLLYSVAILLGIICASFLSGCKDNNTQSKKLPSMPEEKLPNIESPLVFNIIEPSVFLTPIETVKKSTLSWRKRTRQGIYTFIHTDNSDFGESLRNKGIDVQYLKLNQLANKFSELIRQHPERKRLMVFFQTHGQDPKYGKKTAGSLCFKNMNVCSLNENVLVQLIKSINVRHLKQVLFIFPSCYSYDLAKRLGDTMHNEKLLLNFSYKHLALSKSMCSVSDNTFLGRALFFNHFKTQLSKEKMSNIFVEQFFAKTKTTLNELVNLLNQASEFEHELFSFDKELFFLNSFELNKLGLTISYLKCEGHSFGLSVKNYLQNYNIISSHFSKIKKLTFEYELDSGSEEKYSLMVNGDNEKIIKEGIINSSKYCRMHLKLKGD